MKLVTPKAGAKHERLFNKLATAVLQKNLKHTRASKIKKHKCIQKYFIFMKF